MGIVVLICNDHGWGAAPNFDSFPVRGAAFRELGGITRIRSYLFNAGQQEWILPNVSVVIGG